MQIISERITKSMVADLCCHESIHAMRISFHKRTDLRRSLGCLSEYLARLLHLSFGNFLSFCLPCILFTLSDCSEKIQSDISLLNKTAFYFTLFRGQYIMDICMHFEIIPLSLLLIGVYVHMLIVINNR
jgi:hypothetical protein